MIRTLSRRAVRPWLIVSLVAWSGGCAVEDPVAKLRGFDGGSGSFSSDDEEALLAAEGLWLEPGEVPPDCVPPGAEPDSGVACEDAGTPGVP